uniref:CSON008117 protein n=1 Tax=Culicoides sonorensis TaxID=179676 RepID=A0A336KDV5_CULSO
MISRLSKVCINLKSRSNPMLFMNVRIQNRSLHTIKIQSSSNLLARRHPDKICIENLVRYASTVSLKDLPPIPDAPPIPLVQESTSAAETVINQIAANGEPTFASIGLGGWSPVGIVQQIMEFFHVTLDIPWWGAIAIGTVIVRTLLFPLVILAQRNAAIMHNNMPQMQVLQAKMTEARQMGNQIDSARYAQELMLFMKEKNLSPFKNMIVPLAQAPLFISFFMGLRQMANTPVQSMTHGGLFWFTDLTMPDQFYLLPIITSFTMLATIELGTDSARLSSQNMQTMRYVLRALPFCILPFTVNFPAAILTYWTCSNFISLAQQRQRLDEIRFARAGKGPLVKTFKYDPTKPRPSSSDKSSPAVAAKKS